MCSLERKFDSKPTVPPEAVQGTYHAPTVPPFKTGLSFVVAEGLSLNSVPILTTPSRVPVAAADRPSTAPILPAAPTAVLAHGKAAPLRAGAALRVARDRRDEAAPSTAPPKVRPRHRSSPRLNTPRSLEVKMSAGKSGNTCSSCTENDVEAS